ncbi:uncharacterized protein LOC143427468 isoform X1 [Xylocopa sonorina]|uniref:uncharacterized protein LOC143427468 isoform X1 n=1 Tax=Xylocopa sonorina TaxID=1818115 RepID=UPI00403A8F01
MLQENQASRDYEDDDWMEKFIQTIQSKPPIYNSDLPEHCDRNLNSRLWNEVCEAMISTWKDMTSSEKVIKVKELQSKWRNLRTCFRREINKQREEASGQAAKRRRKYIYFNQLLFLLPTLEHKSAISKCSPKSSPNITREDVSDTEDGCQNIQAMEELHSDAMNNISQTDTSIQQKLGTPTCNQSHGKTKRAQNYEESLLTILKEKEDDVIDEDKFFLLSLLPTFKKMSDDQKFEAKMEFLATLKRIIKPNQRCFYSGP